MGDSFESIFFADGNSNDVYWWSHVADAADKYADVREELLAKLADVRSEQLYSELLYFLGRNRPKSSLLLDHCLRVIKGEGRPTGRWVEIDTAAYLLGRDFAGDETVLAAILAGTGNSHWPPDRVVWACCEGLENAEVVSTAYKYLKTRDSATDFITIQGITDMHLLCRRGTADEVFSGLMEFVSRLHTDLTYHSSALLRPLLRRVRLDHDLRAKLRITLASPKSSSEAYSIAPILYRAVGLETELRDWCLNATAAAHKESSLYFDVGFDLTTGVVRTKWEVGMDILYGLGAV